MSTQLDNELRGLFISPPNPLEGKDFLTRVSKTIAANERAKYWRRRIGTLAGLGLVPLVFKLSIDLVASVSAQIAAASDWTVATAASLAPTGLATTLQAYGAMPLYAVAISVAAIILCRDVLSD